jgi:hypothetical protein
LDCERAEKIKGEMKKRGKERVEVNFMSCYHFLPPYLPRYPRPQETPGRGMRHSSLSGSFLLSTSTISFLSNLQGVKFSRH